MCIYIYIYREREREECIIEVSEESLRMYEVSIQDWILWGSIWWTICGLPIGKHLRASVERPICSSEMQKDRMTRWLSDSVTNWENDRKTKMSEWQWHRATEWHSDRVTEWQNGKRVGWWDVERVERVCEWVGMGGWVAGKMVMLVLPPNWHPRSPDFQHRATFFRTQNIKLK